ncbi:MAG: hypothetical protein HQK52_21485 [Oligoflexia bacterium]|nr:hypothetical protein [Oligoflexia bacterium]
MKVFDKNNNLTKEHIVKRKFISITSLFPLLFALALFSACGIQKGGIPQGPTRTLHINNNDAYTNHPEVMLSLFASDGATEMYITNVSDCSSGGVWEPYATSRAWSLAVNGGRTGVYAKFKYANNFVSECIAAGIDFGMASFGGRARDITGSGNYIYVAKDFRGVEVYEIAQEPALPTFVTNLNTPGEAMTVFVAGNYLYVADYYNGLVIYDITNPRAPAWVSTYPMSNILYAYASGNYAYLATSDLDGIAEVATDYMVVIDISTPSTPILKATFTNAGNGIEIYRCVQKGVVTYLYCVGGTGSDDLLTIDISTITAPTLADTDDLAGAGSASDIVLDSTNDLLYIADGTTGVYTYSIATAANPAASEVTDYGDIRGLFLDASLSYLFMAGYDAGLVVANISNSDDRLPATYGSMTLPAVEGYFSSKIYVAAARYAELARYAYIADDYNGIKVVDLANTATPPLAGKLYTVAYGRDIDVSGGYAYVADQTYGLDILNVTNPMLPTIESSYGHTSPISFRHVNVDGSYVYASTSTTLYIVDPAVKTAPALAGSLALANINDIAISGSYLYAATDTGLTIVDITSKTAPVAVGTYATTGSCYNVLVDGNVIYLADTTDGVVILDTTDKTAPALTTTVNTVGTAYDIALDGTGNYLYVADGRVGITVIDVTDPAAPVIVKTYYQALKTYYALEVSGDYLYAGNDELGISVFNIKTPATPAYVRDIETKRGMVRASLSSVPYYYNLVVDGNYLYVSDYYGPIQIYNIAQKALPLQ